MVANGASLVCISKTVPKADSSISFIAPAIVLETFVSFPADLAK